MKKATDYLLSAEIQMEERITSGISGSQIPKLCPLGCFSATEGLFPQNVSFTFFATYIYHVDGFFCFS